MSFASSRIPGFYRLGIAARRRALAERNGISAAELSRFDDGAIRPDQAEHMIENVIGTYALPLGVAMNFRINDRDYVLPMAIEEPSVVAAASNAARIVRAGGGFTAEVSAPVMIGQVQLVEVPDPVAAAAAIHAARDQLLTAARAHTPRLTARGGGPVDIQARILSLPEQPDGGMVVVHLLVDCRDAMGANLVNSLAENLADQLADLAGGRPGLRIVSNLSDQRTVTVRCRIPDAAIGGAEVRTAVAAASRFAELDPYRATTHNKGIMNGIDAVLVATGQDWRGVEAGAHAYAARSGRYAPLSTWHSDGDQLVGTLTLPLAVGTVGGAVQAHDGARLAMALLCVDSAAELASVAAAAGLASNLAALRALATVGIQQGHMSLHARMVATSSGASGDLVERIAAELAAVGEVNQARARAILDRLRRETDLATTLTLEESL